MQAIWAQRRQRRSGRQRRKGLNRRRMWAPLMARHSITTGRAESSDKEFRDSSELTVPHSSVRFLGSLESPDSRPLVRLRPRHRDARAVRPAVTRPARALGVAAFVDGRLVGAAAVCAVDPGNRARRCAGGGMALMRAPRRPYAAVAGRAARRFLDRRAAGAGAAAVGGDSVVAAHTSRGIGVSSARAAGIRTRRAS